MQVSRQDLLLHQVALAEDIILLLAEALTIPNLIALLAVHLTIDHQEQIQVLDPPLLMEEVSLLDTIMEIRQVDPILILPALVLQAVQALVKALAHLVEVQADPQVAQAQEDPEEGGINSPFFLDNLSENTHYFVTNPT